MQLQNPDSSQQASGVRTMCKNEKWARYMGTAEALITAGLLEPAWIEGIGHLSRLIVRQKEGGFFVVAEGGGNHLKRSHIRAGAVSIKRCPDGAFIICVWRNDVERKAYEAAEKAKWAEESERQAAERQHDAWELAKAARGENDYAQRWRSSLLTRLDEVQKLIDGRLVFEGFPEMGLSDQGVESARQALHELRRVLNQSTPIINDRERVSNVVSIRDAAYRFMNRG